MSNTHNHLGQPIGEPLQDWKIPCRLTTFTAHGTYCRLEPLDPLVHGPELFQAFQQDKSGRGWTYLPYGPFASDTQFFDWLGSVLEIPDSAFFSILHDGRAAGLAAYLRLQPAHGCFEIGHIHLSPSLQQTAAATEALFLMIRRGFQVGYRRCEWKCDSLNDASKRAALRLGFIYEGTFRQAVVYKGRNRDTDWFSITDKEWPRLNTAFEAWLNPANFDSAGRQQKRLDDFRRM